jgi:hypothetical protein
MVALVVVWWLLVLVLLTGVVGSGTCDAMVLHGVCLSFVAFRGRSGRDLQETMYVQVLFVVRVTATWSSTLAQTL